MPREITLRILAALPFGRWYITTIPLVCRALQALSPSVQNSHAELDVQKAGRTHECPMLHFLRGRAEDDPWTTCPAATAWLAKVDRHLQHLHLTARNGIEAWPATLGPALSQPLRLHSLAMHGFRLQDEMVQLLRSVAHRAVLRHLSLRVRVEPGVLQGAGERRRALTDLPGLTASAPLLLSLETTHVPWRLLVDRGYPPCQLLGAPAALASLTALTRLSLAGCSLGDDEHSCLLGLATACTDLRCLAVERVEHGLSEASVLSLATMTALRCNTIPATTPFFTWQRTQQHLLSDFELNLNSSHPTASTMHLMLLGTNWFAELICFLLAE